MNKKTTRLALAGKWSSGKLPAVDGMSDGGVSPACPRPESELPNRSVNAIPDSPLQIVRSQSRRVSNGREEPEMQLSSLAVERPAFGSTLEGFVKDGFMLMSL
jgi:hypothetical protein